VTSGAFPAALETRPECAVYEGAQCSSPESARHRTSGRTRSAALRPAI